ncbi:hypothetical protein GCM10023196_036620 [Actinoallomurus vinaceus]|uniref:Uncharacterized protein n=1 Tax=Actinoallomurus vinaceus TaxID=1080074 RepID=A0ABP8UCV1_9ACTN
MTNNQPSGATVGVAVQARDIHVHARAHVALRQLITDRVQKQSG